MRAHAKVFSAALPDGSRVMVTATHGSVGQVLVLSASDEGCDIYPLLSHEARAFLQDQAEMALAIQERKGAR